MRRISDTIARLVRLQAQYGAHPAAPGSSERLTTLDNFGSNPGALKANCYVPRDLPRGAPLVVVLHGCTQTAAAYDHHSGWSQLADEAAFALLLPEQQRANNPNLCFNWFLPADASRGSGEALSVRQMIDAMVVAHGLDRDRIFVTGLSAGGAMASVMLAAYPEVFAAGAIIAGLPYGSATTIPEAFDRMRGHGGPSEQDLQRLIRDASTHRGPWPRISIWHGSADHTVAPSNADAIVAQWRSVHNLEKLPTYSRKAGGHAKTVWCNDVGEAMVETNMIAGMGHGTPLGNDGLGIPGPYMLDVGISSTGEIAQFWGLTTGRGNSVAARSAALASERVSHPSRLPDGAKVETNSPRPSGSSRHEASDTRGVKKVIEDALRAAGLMR